MCGTCGCGNAEDVSVEGEHVHVLPDGSTVRHHHHEAGAHHHHDAHEHEHLMPDGKVVRHTHEGGERAHPPHGVLTGHSHEAKHEHDRSGEARRISVERDVMERNGRVAALNRARFAADGTFVLNLMSSPGSGKTTLLVRTLEALRGGRPLAVIEGDQHTSLDAERIRATGTPAIQVNTGKACHLDAEMVKRALDSLSGRAGGTLFIENVGNLVCPAGFDLGEAKKVVIASVTEGEDKPLKYPEMFAVADVVVVSKIDLVSALGFDVAQLIANVRRVNPRAEVFQVSARTGQGFDGWLRWLDRTSSVRTEARAS